MKTSGPLREGATIRGTPYQVVRVVGVGGSGYVYEVKHLELGKRFVLKTLELDGVHRDERVERLRAEWRALAKLEHPNIVGVSDARVSETGVPFFVMERLVGETLAATLLRERELPVAETLRVARGLLEGLAAAHEIGIVHRDVKPANLFLTTRGDVKLLDFGIARELDASLPDPSVPHSVGTPRYMSPEQAAGEALDAKTDLYSAGLVLFEMLAGRSPFEGAEESQWLHCHLNVVPARASRYARQPIPTALKAIVASMLEKDPRDRPGSAGEVVERVRELEAILERSDATPRISDDADTLIDVATLEGWDGAEELRTGDEGEPGDATDAGGADEPGEAGDTGDIDDTGDGVVLRAGATSSDVALPGKSGRVVWFALAVLGGVGIGVGLHATWVGEQGGERDVERVAPSVVTVRARTVSSAWPGEVAEMCRVPVGGDVTVVDDAASISIDDDEDEDEERREPVVETSARVPKASRAKGRKQAKNYAPRKNVVRARETRLPGLPASGLE